MKGWVEGWNSVMTFRVGMDCTAAFRISTGPWHEVDLLTTILQQRLPLQYATMSSLYGNDIKYASKWDAGAGEKNLLCTLAEFPQWYWLWYYTKSAVNNFSSLFFNLGHIHRPSIMLEGSCFTREQPNVTKIFNLRSSFYAAAFFQRAHSRIIES